MTMGLLSLHARRAFPAWKINIFMSMCYRAFIYKVCCGDYGVFFALSDSGARWAVHCSKDSVVFPALTMAENT